MDILKQQPAGQQLPGRLVVKLAEGREKESLQARARYQRWYAKPHNRAAAIARASAYADMHREEINAARRARHAKDPDIERQRIREKYHSDAAYRASCLAKSAAHYKANRDAIRAAKAARQQALPKKTYLDIATCPVTGVSFEVKRRKSMAGKKVATVCRACQQHHRLLAGPIPDPPAPGPASS